MRVGLYLAASAALYVGWTSAEAGYHVEVAMLRGLIAAMAVGFVAYLGELVVMTAPPVRRGAPPRATDEPAHDEGVPAPTSIRSDRPSATDTRRAA